MGVSWPSMIDFHENGSSMTLRLGAVSQASYQAQCRKCSRSVHVRRAHRSESPRAAAASRCLRWRRKWKYAATRSWKASQALAALSWSWQASPRSAAVPLLTLSIFLEHASILSCSATTSSSVRNLWGRPWMLSESTLGLHQPRPTVQRIYTCLEYVKSSSTMWSDRHRCALRTLRRREHGSAQLGSLSFVPPTHGCSA